jgi:hypothetical protein
MGARVGHTQRDDGGNPEYGDEGGGDAARDGAASAWCGVRRAAQHGEELGMATVTLGDDRKKGGENVWISRMAIDLA